MSLAKLSAGEGYEYYTRVIATHDANERGTTGIDDYYSEKGESPGVWLGAGLAALGIDEGDQVTESQMRALLGEGLHPNADAIIDAAITEQVALGAKSKDAIRYALKQAQLGRPYSRYTTAPGSYRHECAKALTDWNTAHGHDPRAAVPAEERRRIRTEVALRMFTDDVGREPLNSRELSGWIARASRPSKTAVAGFDLTFSPVKSVSTLWAVASREVAEQIEAAHHAAIRDVISYIESEVLFTRVGRHSVRQVEVAGLIATAFDHRDSRAGDPDLHTHLVVSNNVLRGDGKWGAIDGRMIYRYNVTCSEMYNTRLESHLEASLNLVFADRGDRAGKRPVREVVGVDAELTQEWSKRGRAIRKATATLATKFEQDHGREPTALELVGLSQQATLSTRRSKHAARSQAEQRAAWRADAVAILGSDTAVEQMVNTALSQQIPDREQITSDWIQHTAEQAVAVVSQTRATWQHHHIRAEVERQVRRCARDRVLWGPGRGHHAVPRSARRARCR
ncbi:MobF family relaxase [Nocardia fluminea]|uniref:MobF family relaxase n=1 Tax=Nocardia fluminea TaxID=134984 RepID=UPI00379A1C96